MHLGGSVRYAEQSDIYLLASGGTKVLEEGDQPQGDLPLES
jgi:hypothetical protein